MTYDEVLRWWFGRIDYERRAPKPGDLNLDRMRELLLRLGNPHSQFASIHVAGSKGKGSTCAMIESIFRAAGVRTGLFTSPHLTDVRERIQVDNQLIECDELIAVAATVRPAIEQLEAEGLAPTFFEVTTALGFVHFAQQKVEIAVVEVGLGGRFDATNVLTPLVSVIASISLDHTAILGETLEAIAFEKAGIIKPGVPIVSGVVEPGPAAVIERIAAEKRAPLWRLETEIHHLSDHGQVQVNTPRARWPAMPVPLLGEHQLRNAALAIAVIDLVNEQGARSAIGRDAVAEGLRNVSWPARIEIIATRPITVLDCAHNVASAAALDETLRAAFPPLPRTLIFAASSDKDVAGMFAILAPSFERIFLTRSDSPRAIPPEELERVLAGSTPTLTLPHKGGGNQTGGGSQTFDRPIEAWEAALTQTPADGLIVVAGSVFLAGELRPHVLAAAGRS